MAALQFADLLKELKGTTIPRWTVLVNKIKTKDTFVIDKTTQEVKLNYLDKNIQGLFEQGKITTIQSTYRGQDLFKASNGRKLKLGDIFKSADFGGGKLTFNNSYNTLTTSSANGNETTSRSFLGKHLCQRCDYASASCGEGVACGKRTTIDVEF